MKKQSITEILTAVGEVSPFNERVKALRAYKDLAPLVSVLHHAYDPRIKFMLPEGTPPYTPNEWPDQHHNLYREARKFYLFVEGGNANVPDIKREQLFINLLEMVDQDDAKLLVGMKDKELPVKNITEKLVERAFPHLFE